MLAAWLGVCLLTTWFLRRRPAELLAIVVGLRVVIPSVAAGVFVGTNNGLHPATWLLLIAFAMLLLRHPTILLQELRGHEVLYLLVLVLVGEGVLSTAFRSDAIWLVIYLNTMGSGFLLFFLVRACSRAWPSMLMRFTRIVIAVAAVEAVLAVVQLLVGDPILWVTQRYFFTWFNPADTRSVGTLDSPLDLAMLCVIAIPLAALVQSTLRRVGVALLLLGGAVVSESRTGAAVGATACALLLLTSRMSAGRRVLFTLFTAAVAGWLLLSDNLFSAGLSDRVENDAYSATFRDYALDYFFQQVPREPLLGYGFGASSALHDQGVLFSSLENGYAMYGYDLGIPSVLLFVATFAGVLLRGTRYGHRAFVFAGAAAMLMSASFSGIFTNSAASVMLFAVLAMTQVVDRVPVEEVPSFTRATRSLSLKSLKSPVPGRSQFWA